MERIVHDYIRTLINDAACPPRCEDFASELSTILAAKGYAIGPSVLMSGYEPLRAEAMHVVGDLFALRFGPHKQMELYIEDDGWYHCKATFNVAWLWDLARVAEGAAVEARKK